RRIPKPQHAISLPLQISRPPRIVGERRRMLSAIDLHHQPRLRAGEVDDVGTLWNLALPPPATQPPIAQGIPELGFRLGILATQSPRAVTLGVVLEDLDGRH